MKNFKLKYLTLTIVLTIFSSCSSVDLEEQTEKPIANSNEIAEIFTEYSSFKVNGKKVTDTKEIIKLLIGKFQVKDFNPNKKEINFYTSNGEYRKVNPENLETEVNDESTSSDEFRTTSDLGHFGADYAGVAGLGNFLDLQHYRDFSKHVFLVEKRSEPYSTYATYFYRLNDDTNMNENANFLLFNNHGGIVNTKHVQNYPSLFFKNNSGVVIKNDSSIKKKLCFYELTGYRGAVVYITLDKNATIALGQKLFSLGTGGYPQSYKSVNL